LEFCGGLVKKKLALILCLIDLLGKPSALLENAWAENRLAAADEEGDDEVQEFHGRSMGFLEGLSTEKNSKQQMAK
jgi:hypothetical protein